MPLCIENIIFKVQNGSNDVYNIKGDPFSYLTCKRVNMIYLSNKYSLSHLLGPSIVCLDRKLFSATVCVRACVCVRVCE